MNDFETVWDALSCRAAARWIQQRLRKVEGLLGLLARSRRSNRAEIAEVEVERLQEESKAFENLAIENWASRERLRAEVERLRAGRWTDEERKLFLYEATKASYAEGARAGCEELSIEAAKMSDELDVANAEVEWLRALIRRADPSRDDFEWETWLLDARAALLTEEKE
jgi:hypothetical protein